MRIYRSGVVFEKSFAAIGIAAEGMETWGTRVRSVAFAAWQELPRVALPYQIGSRRRACGPNTLARGAGRTRHARIANW